jgi:biopolymer transport protein ExbB/TolQ
VQTFKQRSSNDPDQHQVLRNRIDSPTFVACDEGGRAVHERSYCAWALTPLAEEVTLNEILTFCGHAASTHGVSAAQWTLCVLTLVSLALAFERWLHIVRSARGLAALRHALHRSLQEPELADLMQQVDRTALFESVLAEERAETVRRADLAERATRDALGRYRSTFERRLALLELLGDVAPFVGVLGTLLRFARGLASASAAALTRKELAIMFMQALVFTVCGVALAIFAHVGSVLLRRAARDVAVRTDLICALLVARTRSAWRPTRDLDPAKPAESLASLALPPIVRRRPKVHSQSMPRLRQALPSEAFARKI